MKYLIVLHMKYRTYRIWIFNIWTLLRHISVRNACYLTACAWIQLLPTAWIRKRFRKWCFSRSTMPLPTSCIQRTKEYCTIEQIPTVFNWNIKYVSQYWILIVTFGVNRLWHRDDPICHSRRNQLSTGEPTFQQRQWNRLSHCHVFHILLPVDSVWGFLSRLNWGFDFIFAGTKWITITGKILLLTFGWEKLVISDIYFTPTETFLSTRSRFANNFRLPILSI